MRITIHWKDLHGSSGLAATRQLEHSRIRIAFTRPVELPGRPSDPSLPSFAPIGVAYPAWEPLEVRSPRLARDGLDIPPGRSTHHVKDDIQLQKVPKAEYVWFWLRRSGFESF